MKHIALKARVFGVLLTGLLAFGAQAGSGSYLSPAGGVAMYSKNFTYTIPFSVPSSVPKNAKADLISWSWKPTARPAGLRAFICSTERNPGCLEITRNESGSTYAFRDANFSAAHSFYLAFFVEGSGTMYSVVISPAQIKVGYTTP